MGWPSVPGSRWPPSRRWRRGRRSRRPTTRMRPPRRPPGRRAAYPSRGADIDRGHAIADLNRIDDIHARGDLTEMVVDPAGREKRRVARRDEELRAAHAGRARSHPRGASRPHGGVGFVGKLVGGSPGAVAQRIAALDDETRHHAVKGEAVVVVVLREVDEVVHRLWSHAGIDEGDREVATRGVHERCVLLRRVDDGGWGRGSLVHAGDNPILAAWGIRGRRHHITGAYSDRAERQ